MPLAIVDLFSARESVRTTIVQDKRPRARVRVLHRDGDLCSRARSSLSPLFLQIYLDEARH